jgi:hypothetical protein
MQFLVNNVKLKNFFNLDINFNLQKNLFFYYENLIQKSQKFSFKFKELNLNVSSIKRLRVSKGICLPSDYSIHLICSSKDVIHS